MLNYFLSWRAALLALILVIVPLNAARAGVDPVNLAGGQVQLTIYPMSLAPAPSSQPTYHICWRRTWQAKFICNANEIYTSANPAIISGLTHNQAYKIRVECWCITNDGGLLGQGWVHVAEITHIYTNPPPPPPPTVISTSIVRIRSVMTNQCSYVATGDFKPRHWSCWNDPAMRFTRLDYSDGTTMFRHVNSGGCLWGAQPNLPSMSATLNCGTMGTRFIVQSASGGAVRLVIPVTKGSGILTPIGPGGCMFADGGDGADMRKQPCSQDLKFNFKLDPA